MAKYGIEELVVYAVFVIATAISLFQYFYIRRLWLFGNSVDNLRNDPRIAEIIAAGPAIIGEIELTGVTDIPPLLNLLAIHLENPGRLMQSGWKKPSEMGSISITRHGERDIEFEGRHLYISRGLVRIVEDPLGKYRAQWALEVSSARVLLITATLRALLLALPVSIAVPFAIAYLMQQYPSVRAQSLQVMQVSQVVWEPFLFSGLARQRMKSAGSYLEGLIAASAYEVRTGRAAFSTSP